MNEQSPIPNDQNSMHTAQELVFGTSSLVIQVLLVRTGSAAPTFGTFAKRTLPTSLDNPAVYAIGRQVRRLIEKPDALPFIEHSA